MRPRVNLLITDLDNTLFDWVSVWHQSFDSMLTKLVEESGVDRGQLINEFKVIHEQYGTSEYAFSIEQLPSLKQRFPGDDLVHRFSNAIKAYGETRERALALYPEVEETLQRIKDKGALIVGYTESMAFYANFRVRFLGLDRILDFLYSPPDHALPAGVTRESIRTKPPEFYQLRRTIERHLPPEEKKPNPQLLLDIVREVGATPDQALYVGDSLMKDVLMAQRASIIDVWAKYGLAQHRPEYELLRRVTHWTKEDVEKEKALSPSDVTPRHTLRENFSELLDLFEFEGFVDRTNERLKIYVDIWKKTVDVQQHFNDLELRIRNFAITIMAGVLGLAAYAIKENLTTQLLNRQISLAAIVLVLGLLPWFGFYFMDRHWYHRLLYGAVHHGKFIEDRLGKVLPELALTESIGKYSPIRIWRWLKPDTTWYWKNREMHSPQKINAFYSVGFLLLVLLSVFCFFAIKPVGTEGTKAQERHPSQLEELSLPVSPEGFPEKVEPSLPRPTPPKDEDAEKKRREQEPTAPKQKQDEQRE